MRSINAILIAALLVSISCTDHQAPEVIITIPSDGASVYGIATIHLSVTDNESVDSVALFIDGEVVCGYSGSPFLYSWNTSVLPDSSVHELCGVAYDDESNEGWSDTISVIVFNGPVLFADDFESYIPGYQPFPIWQEIWPGVLESTYVAQSFPHTGVKSYRSYGYAEYVRTDGIGIAFPDAQRLVYKCSVMIPQESDNGALFGFFVRISPQVGEIYNGVMFDPSDHKVYVRGTVPDTTGFVWAVDLWYDVEVTLDIAQTQMQVSIDDHTIATIVPLGDTALLDTFAISTIYGGSGSVYYDDVTLVEE